MTALEDTASPLSSLFLIIAAYLSKDISDFILLYSVQVFPSPQFISHSSYDYVVIQSVRSRILATMTCVDIL